MKLLGCAIIGVLSILSSQVVFSQSQGRANVASAHSAQSTMMPDAQLVDTMLTPVIPFTPLAVSMHGYVKQLSDRHETFLLRNETHNYRISRVYVRLVYTTTDGLEIYRRDELVDCDIRPGTAQSVDIKTFDKSNNYYYYATPPRRAGGSPYHIKYDILRYDVVVE